MISAETKINLTLNPIVKKDVPLIKNDIISISYFNKEISKRPQNFLAKFISIKGKKESKTIKIVRKFKDDIIFQTFFCNSSHIIQIKKKS